MGEIKVLDKGYVKLINHMGADLSPVLSARVSTNTESDIARDDKLREYLWSNGHTSCFESLIAEIEIKVPLFVLHQLLRHRTLDFPDLEISSSEEGFRKYFSPNEFSGRYAAFEEEFYIPAPEEVRGQDSVNKQGSVDNLDEVVKEEFSKDVNRESKVSYVMYSSYLDRGVSREQARINLPNNIYTKRRIVGSFTNWANFLFLRLDTHAQKESRDYAVAIETILKMLWPKTYSVFEEHTLYGKRFSRTELALIKSLLEPHLEDKKLRKKLGYA